MSAWAPRRFPGEDPRWGQNMGEQRWGRAAFDRAFAGLPGGEEEGVLADADTFADAGIGTFFYGPPLTQGPFAAGGPKGYARSDEQIREDVNERLACEAREYGLDVADVEVQVDGGLVVLRGATRDKRHKYRIEDVAAAISGVIDVENHLRLRRG